MAEKKIQPKRPANEEQAAGSRKTKKTSAKAMKPKKFTFKAIKPKKY
ncbi:MAG TPA: hypothetical protein VGQ50_14645 [Actinomycetota bacterium]|jgi:hypothetical protein|nr:hypothetical protein [Actinomycetota bacterium]